MKPAQARRLVRLYPHTWRARYEEEFVAMLEPQPPSVGVFLNVLAGALDAQARRASAAAAAFLERGFVPWLCWTLACAAGWVGLLAVLYLAFLRYAVSAGNIGAGEVAARLVIGGLGAGAALGAAQWLVVRHALPAAERWVMATAGGWLLGAALALALQAPLAVAHLSFGWPGDQLLRGGEFGLVTGGVVGAAQWRLLRRQARHAGWWAATSAAGWGLGWLVGALHSNEMLGGSDIGPAFHPMSVATGVLLAPALGGALAGLLTGPLLTVLLPLQAPLPLLVRGRRAALPALAACVALVAAIAIPAVEQSRRPAWRIQPITQWPAELVIPIATPLPSTTPRPGGADFSTGMFVATTAAAARPHLPFRVLLPAALPPGYQPAKAMAPRSLFQTPRLRPEMAWLQLVYFDPAHQRPGHDWRTEPSALPDQALTIDETVANGAQPVFLMAPAGAAHPLSIDGTPAVYLDAGASGRPGSAAVVPDPAVQQLVFAPEGTLVTITGRRDADLDRAALERLAASLR